jgi:hypothetical protein
MTTYKQIISWGNVLFSNAAVSVNSVGSSRVLTLAAGTTTTIMCNAYYARPVSGGGTAALADVGLYYTVGANVNLSAITVQNVYKDILTIGGSQIPAGYTTSGFGTTSATSYCGTITITPQTPDSGQPTTMIMYTIVWTITADPATTTSVTILGIDANYVLA